MNILNYSLTAVVVYLGLLVGFILAMMAKEEMKDGRRYFVFLQKLILLLVFVFLLVFIRLNYILVLLILVFIVVYLLKRKNELVYIYMILGVIFYLSSKTLNLFVIESSLIFLYGIPTGSLLTKRDKKESLIGILKNVGFVVVAVVLFLVF
jgi:hypothetical protein